MKAKVLLGVSLCLLLIGCSTVLVQAMEIIKQGTFRLQAKQEWDKTLKKSLVNLDWENVNDLSNDGYSIYQSTDQKVWEKRSASYGKAITVLNVYPDQGNTLKEWMDSLKLKDKEGKNLIQVTMVSITNFNANPDNYLKKGDTYMYDVIMFGSWDWNYGKDLTDKSAKALKSYIDTGKGVLFGHDTITGSNYSGSIMTPSHVYFNRFEAQLGLELAHQSYYRVGSKKIQITNNGYLMKYPFELKNNQTLDIPLTHSWGQAIKPNTSVIKWAAFTPPFEFAIQTGKNDGNFYLVTNNNVGLIQTGHSNSQSTMDERKIIANTLYNLAQVTLDTHADDYSVKDDVAPESPTVKVDEQDYPKLKVTLDASDKGKDYYYYVEAATKKSGTVKSDTVKENVCSNIQGYIYTVDQTATTEPAATRDEYGVITNLTKTVDADSSTAIVLDDFDAIRDAEKWLHVRAIDRANNVGATKHVQIKEILTTYQITEQYFNSSANSTQPVAMSKTTRVKKKQNYVSTFQQFEHKRLLTYQLDTQQAETVAGKTKVEIENIQNHHTLVYRYEPIMTIDFSYLDEETQAELAPTKRVQLNETEAQKYRIEKPIFSNKQFIKSSPSWNPTKNLGDKLDFWSANAFTVQHLYHATQAIYVQVIGDQQNQQIVQQVESYLTLGIEGQVTQTATKVVPIQKKATSAYEKIVLLRNQGDRNLMVQLVLPEYFQFAGYQVKQEENPAVISGNEPRVNISLLKQTAPIYLTLHLKNEPNKSVQRYSWTQKESAHTIVKTGTAIPDP